MIFRGPREARGTRRQGNGKKGRKGGGKEREGWIEREQEKGRKGRKRREGKMKGGSGKKIEQEDGKRRKGRKTKYLEGLATLNPQATRTQGRFDLE